MREGQGYSGTTLDCGGGAALGGVVAMVHEQRREWWHEHETTCQVSSPRTRVALEGVKSVGDAADKLRREVCPGTAQQHGGARILARLGNFLKKNEGLLLTQRRKK